MSNYYKDQVLKLNSTLTKSVSFSDTLVKTNNLDLNLESIPEIMEFLRLEMKRLLEIKSEEYLKVIKK